VVLAIAVAVGFGSDVYRKQQFVEARQYVLQGRDGIWRMAFAAWQRYPWFGVGMDNYDLISHELVRSWRTEAGKDYDASIYTRFPHGHNLFVNALAERGVAGVAALGAVLLAWIVTLVRRRPRPQDADVAWLAWGSAASAWIVTVTVGMVNTTLHHEHGLLAALLLGIWLSTLPALRAHRAS
jgi:O-antigen ligase